MTENSVKGYAKQVKNNYSSIISKLQKKYEVMSNGLKEEYIARNAEISEENKKAKNAASASHKIDLANSQRTLMDKGLAKSGESINTEIRSNLSKNQAFATLDREAEKSRRENSLSLTKALGDLASKRFEEEAGLEERMSEAEREQANLDREWEQSERKFESDEEQRHIENDRADRQFASSEEQRHIENDRADRQFASSEEQRHIENDRADRQFASSEEQRHIENDRADREFAADEEQRWFENSQKSADGGNTSASGKGTSSTSKKTKSDDGTVPTYDADELVDRIYEVYQGRYYKSYKDRDEDIKRAIYSVLNDTTLSAEYKRGVRVYASSLGYI